MDSYFDLGPHTFPVTTESPETQCWFDRGLNWCYAFNHEEAEFCFRKAIEHDPECGMAYWGLAYAAGPNYNMPWFNFTDDELQSTLSVCYDASQKALTKVSDATELERGLIDALARRFQADSVQEIEQCQQWNEAYAQAMRMLYQKYSAHSDIVALAADALMSRTPWQLWDLERGEPPEGSDTLEVKQILEAEMARLEAAAEPHHAGILHYYIHLMEMSPIPEEALPASRALGGLIPDAGHLHHMPSHIYVLCGQYEESLTANEIAHAVNEKYLAYAGANNFYTIYRAHDIHFVMYSAMFLGQSQRAIEAATEMASMISPELIHEGKAIFKNYMDGFVAMGVHAYIRFGRWHDIISMPLPEEPESYCVTTAMLHYAKGVAHAALGQIESAEAERELFDAAYLQVPEKRMIFNNESRDILDVGREMLLGELAYRKEDYEIAFTHLHRSVELHDNLKYTEPWVWMQPTRHALGALLLEQERVEEAAAIYRADLGLDKVLGRPYWHQNNVWGLHGYHECLQHMEQHEEAAMIKPKLTHALAKADIEISSSCFCRREHLCCDE
ncbi:MAG: hypothetical protein AAF702_27240 [Chloroflexota bacterium]